MGIADRYAKDQQDEQYLNKAAQATERAINVPPNHVVPGSISGAGQCPSPVPQAHDYDPTVAEFLRERIQMLQSEIKGCERRYMEARAAGILDMKARTLRDMIGY